MIIFLGVVAKKHAITPEFENHVKSVADKTLTFRNMSFDYEQWKSESSRVALYAWNNSPLRKKEGPVIDKSPSYALTMSGYGSNPETSTQQDFFDRLNEAAVPKNIAARLGGITATAYADGTQECLRAWTSYLRMISIFWCENENYYFVGNRAILTHLVSRRDGRPVYDLQGMVPFLLCGHFASESTPFERLHILPPNVELKLTPSGSAITPLDGADELTGKGSRQPDETYWDELTNELLKALNPVKNTGIPVVLGLTGGKDSRLLGSALKTVGIPFVGFTTGAQDHPDVLVARKIAKILGIEHDVKPPPEANDQVRMNLKRTVPEQMFGYDCMLHFWSTQGTVPVFDTSNLRLTGQGGEFMRGGWLKNPKNNKGFETRSNIDALLRDNFLRFPSLFLPERVSEYQQFLEGWVTREMEDKSPRGVIEKMFFYIYGGRWVSSSFMFRLSQQPNVYPLSDSNFVKKSQEIPVRYRTNDIIIYNILKRLEPRLIDIPFNKWRWNFELDGPRDGNYKSWMQRAPYKMGSFSKAAVNWKHEAGSQPELKKAFQEEILDNDRNCKLFEILDRDKFENLFYSPEIMKTRSARFLFNVISASAILSNSWLETNVTAANDVVTIRTDYRWFKINNRLVNLMNKSFKESVDVIEKNADKAARRLRKNINSFLSKNKGEFFGRKSAKTVVLTDGFDEQIVNPLCEQIFDLRHRAVSKYLKKLGKRIEKTQNRFGVSAESWVRYLRQFKLLSGNSENKRLSLADIQEKKDNLTDVLISRDKQWEQLQQDLRNLILKSVPKEMSQIKDRTNDFFRDLTKTNLEIKKQATSSLVAIQDSLFDTLVLKTERD